MGTTKRPSWIVGAAIGVLVLSGVAVLVSTARVGAPPKPVAVAAADVDSPARTPTLYCDFYDFMHRTTVVSFYFSVAFTRGDDPQVSELFVVEPDGAKTAFGGDAATAPPRWAYTSDDGTPTITSPDKATDIILYGLKPDLSGTFWVEAGIRSNDYRNLDGKCRQADFGVRAAKVKKSNT